MYYRGILFLVMTFAWQSTFANKQPFAETLCQDPKFFCVKIVRGDTWDKLFPDPYQEEIVRRVNRKNIKLRIGAQLAIPMHLEKLTIMDLSPFPETIEGHREEVLMVDTKQHAYAAYDKSGQQVWWGPISAGKGFCKDSGQSCITYAGEFRMFRKKGAECVSSKYPLDKSKPRAPMPYCMFFNRGIAFHGARLPGWHDSHGCVRVFKEDAKWLNEKFIRLYSGPGTTGGTKVIVRET